MKFTYMKTPLNRYTFKSKKLRMWVENHVEGKVLNLFAGKTKLNCDEVRNDLDPLMPAKYHKDALEFCKSWSGPKFDTVLVDAPYSFRKSMEMYNGKVQSPFNATKDAIVGILNPNGIVMTFGYQSNVMGAVRGFKQEHLLVISHGGAIHDTLCIIERHYIDKGVLKTKWATTLMEGVE